MPYKYLYIEEDWFHPHHVVDIFGTWWDYRMDRKTHIMHNRKRLALCKPIERYGAFSRDQWRWYVYSGWFPKRRWLALTKKYASEQTTRVSLFRQLLDEK